MGVGLASSLVALHRTVKVGPIDGLNVTIPAGSLALPLGPSGCDKTALLERVDGTETPVAIVTAGEHFGEMVPLFGLPRSATARARTPCALTACTVKAFRERYGLRHLGDLIGSSN